ncbi:unnamed protein product [Callosobruchus maculatus]|uniref:AB hydrolase-1 domain-containing protein n=1 Tax=Callosobruchus maculatus TaxID=64391 RepID=A0A653CNV0_CALMS|nr:unnamed protein product [Callosobruchus maculatus]
MNGCGGDNFNEVEIPVPWGHITGKWWGPRNVQPVIAIHGWQDNCGTFDNLAPLLVKGGLSVYCIDLPGHGFSSHLPPGQIYYIFWDGIHYLRRIVKHFNWKNIKLIGHSLGGGIAFLYAAVYPKDVDRYVSIDIASPSVRIAKKMVDLMGHAVDKFMEYETKSVNSMPCYVYDEMVDLVYDAYKGTVTRKGCEIMLRRGMKPAVHKEGHYVFTRDPRLKTVALGFMTLDQVLEFASRIKCRVMVITASTGLRNDIPEAYDKVLDTLEQSADIFEHVKFEGTHHLHLNDAETIAPCTIKFLCS